MRKLSIATRIKSAPRREICSSELTWDPWAYDSRPDEPLRRKHVDVGTRIVVPNHKLKYDQSNPTGHGIIFLSRGDYVYCYVAPGGV